MYYTTKALRNNIPNRSWYTIAAIITTDTAYIYEKTDTAVLHNNFENINIMYVIQYCLFVNWSY